MYAITGASGQLGRLVVQELLKTHSPGEIVAAVRSPEKAADLAALGVVVRHADYDLPETLDAAFAGVDKALLISSSAVTGRFAQHEAVIRAVKNAGVGLLAYTSMLRADTSTAKLAIEHNQTEQAIRASGTPWVMLRNAWYTENHLLSLDAALAHGAFVGAAKNGFFSSAARIDYAVAAAGALTGEDQAGKVYELAGDDSFTLGELAAEVARQSGKAVVYNDMSEADYKALLVSVGLPEPLADMLADADARVADDGVLFDGGRAMSTLIGRPTIPMRHVVEQVLRG
ncbi:SDR family oxidoreductase [Sphingomonas endolithica]|uniref:SDR family oxidoreductase n=1 Tax=Sphingomonas endolithica TaxID=2972485 RepID=UPI0021AFFF2A|nr:SDR family oxidoreductase [Sphingomonas sp. ZFBP2030]